VNTSAYKIAERFIGMTEVPGTGSNPAILAMLRLDMEWPEGDEVPWCSGFVNYVAWLLRLPRSKSLRARSWLQVGMPVSLDHARVGFDVVVLARGGADQPGPDVINAPGHVGLYAGSTAGGSLMGNMLGVSSPSDAIAVLGGNQGNSVSVAWYPATRLLGVRRLWEEA
jgi:uncharacterized protein (TIGR02594 family)